MTHPTIRFGDLYLVPSRNGLNRPKSVRGDGFRMVNMGELFRNEFLSDQSMERVPMNTKEIELNRLEPYDLLFARQSLVLEGTGKCSIFIGHPEVTTFESHINRVRLNRTLANPYFYFYFFKSVQGRALMQTITMQVAASGIRASELQNLNVPHPSLDIQDKIVAALAAYDDLIENNKLRIKLLEEMAQRIYREWFVDFRYPGHQTVPLVDSELGPIPEGWHVRPFTEIADVLSGGTPRTTEEGYWNGNIPFFTPRDAPDSLVALTTEKHVTQVGLDHCNSALYQPGTVFITARGTVGKVALAGVAMAMNQSCYAIRGREGICQEFLLFSLMNQVDYLKTNTGGATFDTIVVDTFRRMNIAAPPSQLVDSFGNAVGPILQMIRNLQIGIEVASNARDLLLPRLLSGEIDVSRLNIALPEAAA